MIEAEEVRALVAHMQDVSDRLGKVHPSRGCIGCHICTCRNMLEGMSDGPAEDIIIRIRDEEDGS